MNRSLIAGLALGAAIVALAVFRSTTTPWIFLNLAGFLIVAGGMISASFIMYPWDELKNILRTVGSCFKEKQTDNVLAIQEMVKLAQLQGEDPLFFSWKLDGITHNLLRDGVELLAVGTRSEEIRRRLELISNSSLEQSIKHSGALLSLAKLGPGFGLMGTLLGLVVMLQDMGTSGNFDHVGPALALSLLATLYGVITSNLFLQPVRSP
jgi:chemotaxis protein MotA